MPRSPCTYDHRLVRLVQDTGDITIATGVGVPRSTAAGWLRRAKRSITTVGRRHPEKGPRGTLKRDPLAR